MRKSCGYHKSYDELCKKWCVKIIFTNYNFIEIEICGETNFPKKKKQLLSETVRQQLSWRAPISQPRKTIKAKKKKKTSNERKKKL